MIAILNNEITKSEYSTDVLVSQFINSQDIKDSSKNAYRRSLKQYFIFLNTKYYLLKNTTREHVLEYKQYLLNTGMSSLTVGSYITSVRRFYEWAEANKFYPNIAKGIKTPKRKQQFRKQPLLPAQATELINHYNTPKERAIINLLLRTGLRTVEVIRANVEDIVYKGSQRVLLVQGKGRDERDNFVILTEKTYEPIRQYLASRVNISPLQPLFTSTSNNSQGQRLSTRTISFIAKEGLKAIGLNDKSFTAHSLRHTTAVNILRAGGSLETAQFTLRHSNPATTQIYTATLTEERRLQNSGEALIDSLY